MAYGQKNYNEIQGIAGKYRIAQIGCMLVSFCNGLEHSFGIKINPLELNARFRDNGRYVDVDDGIKDDLGWGSISAEFPDIVVTASGDGAPNRNNTMVKFNYKSPSSGNFTTHFGWVIDWQKRLFIDAWDGQVKDWNIYGGPIAWAAFARNVPEPVAPVAPTAPASNPNQVTVQAGWGISHVLKARGYPDFGSPDRWNWLAQQNGRADYTQFKLYANQVVNCPPYSAPVPAPTVPAIPVVPPAPPAQPDVIDVIVQSGWGISHVLKAAGYPQASFSREDEWDRVARLNGSDTRLRLSAGQVVKVHRHPLSLPQPEPTSATTAVAEPIAPVTPVNMEPAEPVSAPIPFDDDEDDWKDSFKEVKGHFTAKLSDDIHDLDGQLPKLYLPEGTPVSVGSIGVGPDGKVYYRSTKHTRRNVFYGIPENMLKPVGNDENDDDIAEITEQIRDEERKRREAENKIDLKKESADFVANLTNRQVIVKLAAKIYGNLQKIKFWKRK